MSGCTSAVGWICHVIVVYPDHVYAVAEDDGKTNKLICDERVLETHTTEQTEESDTLGPGLGYSNTQSQHNRKGQLNDCGIL